MPKERDDEARKAWLEAVLKQDANRLAFPDETGGWLGMPRLYGRCVGGARVYDTAPKKRKGRISLIAAITNKGMNPQTCLIHEDGVDAKAFLSHIEHALCPTLEPGQTVIMDNFTIHRNSKVRELIEGKACTLLYLPTYSPDFNPIENLFAKIKAFIRRLRPDTVKDLLQAFSDAVLSVKRADAKNAFDHCGYLSH